MQTNIYSIFDTATGLYSRPFFDLADAAAIRAFGEIATGSEHPIASHPEDYTLFRIGSYDDRTATIISTEKECLATALELVSASRNVDKEQLALFEQHIPREGVQ